MKGRPSHPSEACHDHDRRHHSRHRSGPVQVRCLHLFAQHLQPRLPHYRLQTGRARPVARRSSRCGRRDRGVSQRRVGSRSCGRCRELICVEAVASSGERVGLRIEIAGNARLGAVDGGISQASRHRTLRRSIQISGRRLVNGTRTSRAGEPIRRSKVNLKIKSQNPLGSPNAPGAAPRHKAPAPRPDRSPIT